jgi:hypothetical protein
MPQLIAMVIVVVGAMIYMFQTFGGTGDKIEGIAQKTSIITEINNVRNGLQLAVRAGDITSVAIAADTTATPPVSAVPKTTLKALAELGYFADQMNNEIVDNTTTGNANQGTNTYSAISFGGETNPGMLLNLITNATTATGTNITKRPGIRVVLTGTLAGNANFLESQIATDLASIASIDRTTTDGTAVTLDENGDVPTANSATTGTAAGDGIFTIYFKDMPADVIQ